MARQLTSIPGLDYLNRDGFTLTDTEGAGTIETVAEFLVPRGEARKFLKTNGALTLGTKASFNGDGAETEFLLPHTIANSPRAFKIPAILYFEAAGVRTYKTYTASAAPGAGEFTVLFATNEVKTGDVAPIGVDNVNVFYPPVSGRYSIEVFNPTERRHETFGNNTFRKLHAAPQTDVNSPWMMNETPWIPQDYPVRLQVISAAPIDVDEANVYTNLEFPFLRKPIGQMTKDEYAQTVAALGA